MFSNPWLPRGYRISEDLTINSLAFSGNDWQIYNTQDSKNILFCSESLTDRWVDHKYLDRSVFKELRFGEKTYQYFSCHKDHVLAPLEGGKIPFEKSEGLSFAFALKESRQISTKDSFHDSIFVEKFSRLLPTWTISPQLDDEVVLGKWLTGGVEISIRSFRRLVSLVGWMSPSDLVDIILAAGVTLPTDALIHVKEDNLTTSGHGLTFLTKQKMSTDKPEDSSKVIPSRRVFRLPGRPVLEEFFNEHIIDIIDNVSKYKKMGIDFPSPVVLFGPPGCGKTFAVERLIDFIDWPSYSIDSNTVGSPFIHDTSKKISDVFSKAIDNAPSVLVIDEMESFLSDRRFSQSSGSGLHHIEEVAEFLQHIPEAISNSVLIIAMTNMIDLIDPAILRRGRFDHIIEVGMPSRIEVASLIDSLLSKIPKSEDLNLDPLVDFLSGKPLSDSAFVIREAARIAAKNGKHQVDQESLFSALSSLPKEDIKKQQIGF